MKDNKCLDCGKPIENTSTRCRSCASRASALKNSEGLKRAYAEGRRKVSRGAAHRNYGPASKEWRIANPERYAEARAKQKRSMQKRIDEGTLPKRNFHHSEETKKKLSAMMSERLRNPEFRKNYGRGKPSHMEEYFASWLARNGLLGWVAEKHFWNPEARKNYFVDFYFEDLKLAVELDGTQHRKTVEADSIRDNWLSRQGNTVIRITYEEYRTGAWESALLKRLRRPTAESVRLERIQ